MRNSNEEIYCAIINLIDYITKIPRERNISDMEEFHIRNTIAYLGEIGGIDIQAVGDANDCGSDCRTWGEVIDGFKEQWRCGQRVGNEVMFYEYN